MIGSYGHAGVYKNLMRLDKDMFDWLLERVQHRIRKQRTVMRPNPITVEERLAVTLRFLASGILSFFLYMYILVYICINFRQTKNFRRKKKFQVK